MIRRVHLILLCSVLCWLTAGTTQAGYVSPDFLADSSSSSASSSRSRTPDQDRPVEDPSQSKDESLLAANSALDAQGSTSGMGGGHGSAGQINALGLTQISAPEFEPLLVSAYLIREADFVLPDAYLDRVFRPPRLNSSVAA